MRFAEAPVPLLQGKLAFSEKDRLNRISKLIVGCLMRLINMRSAAACFICRRQTAASQFNTLIMTDVSFLCAIALILLAEKS